jgi:predicted GNAT family N-acyltransferase
MIEVVIAAFDSPTYQACTQLRNTILRIPLGMNLFDEDLSHEANDIHIAALENEVLLGCMVLSPKPGNVLKMRQVAVANEVQNKGIGKSMVSFAEHWAQNNGFTCIELHARKTAVPFYSRQQYQTIGAEFIEVGIPHYKMQKML